MALPSNVGHGTVTGRFIDSTGAAIEGSVTFTPSPKRLLNATADPSPVTILPQPVTVTLDEGGEFTAELVATDDPDNNPSGWTYAVKFAFKSVTAAGFDIEVPEGTTVNLTTVSPVGSSGGVSIIQGPAPEIAWDGTTIIVDGVPGPDLQGPSGGGADLTSYTQVSSLAGYPATFPPDLTGVTPASIGAQPAGDYLTEADLPAPPDLSGYATTAALDTGLASKADTSDLFSGSYDDLTGKPSIPATPADIGAQPAGSYATAAQGALADTAVQPAGIAGMVTSQTITQIVALTQAAYDALTPDPATLYVITDA